MYVKVQQICHQDGHHSALLFYINRKDQYKVEERDSLCDTMKKTAVVVFFVVLCCFKKIYVYSSKED